MFIFYGKLLVYQRRSTTHKYLQMVSRYGINWANYNDIADKHILKKCQPPTGKSWQIVLNPPLC